MDLTTTLTLLDLSRIYNRNRCVFCTWHSRYGLPYTSLHGNVARISIKDLLAFFDKQIRTSNTPKCWIDNKNTLLTYIKNQNTTPTMISIVNRQSPATAQLHRSGDGSIVNTLVQLDPGATIPTRAHETDVGYDVTSCRFTVVHPNGMRTICTTEEHITEATGMQRYDHPGTSYIEIDTGVHITPPPGYYFELVPNSRQAKTTVAWNNSFGVIDPTYTGSIKIIIKKGKIEDLARYLPGNVVGQLILRRRYEAEFEHVDTLEETERGAGGFGSTANK